MVDRAHCHSIKRLCCWKSRKKTLWSREGSPTKQKNICFFQMAVQIELKALSVITTRRRLGRIQTMEARGNQKNKNQSNQNPKTQIKGNTNQHKHNTNQTRSTVSSIQWNNAKSTKLKETPVQKKTFGHVAWFYFFPTGQTLGKLLFVFAVFWSTQRTWSMHVQSCNTTRSRRYAVDCYNSHM